MTSRSGELEGQLDKTVTFLIVDHFFTILAVWHSAESCCKMVVPDIIVCFHLRVQDINVVCSIHSFTLAKCVNPASLCCRYCALHHYGRRMLDCFDILDWAVFQLDVAHSCIHSLELAEMYFRHWTSHAPTLLRLCPSWHNRIANKLESVSLTSKASLLALWQQANDSLW